MHRRRVINQRTETFLFYSILIGSVGRICYDTFRAFNFTAVWRAKVIKDKLITTVLYDTVRYSKPVTTTLFKISRACQTQIPHWQASFPENPRFLRCLTQHLPAGFYPTLLYKSPRIPRWSFFFSILREACLMARGATRASMGAHGAVHYSMCVRL